MYVCGGGLFCFLNYLALLQSSVDKLATYPSVPIYFLHCQKNCRIIGRHVHYFLSCRKPLEVCLLFHKVAPCTRRVTLSQSCCLVAVVLVWECFIHNMRMNTWKWKNCGCGISSVISMSERFLSRLSFQTRKEGNCMLGSLDLLNSISDCLNS